MPELGGQIVIDGQNIQQLSLPSYRSKISIIPQDPVLFSGPLRFNLDPGNEFEDAQIWNALEAVQLKSQPRSQGFSLLNWVGGGSRREKTLASAGHVPILHPKILGVIN